MKKLLLFLTMIMAISVFAITGMAAEEDAPIATESIISYDGLSVRSVQDYAGLRSLYTVNDELVDELIRRGHTVQYGALMGIGDYVAGDGTAKTGVSVNTMTVAIRDGRIVAMGNGVEGYACAAVTVFDSEGTYGASGMYTSHAVNEHGVRVSSFAYTTTFDYSGMTVKNLKDTQLVYRAFLIIDGEASYVDAVGDVFGGSGDYGSSTSLYEVCDFFTTNEAYSEKWGSKPAIQNVIDVCNGAGSTSFTKVFCENPTEYGNADDGVITKDSSAEARTLSLTGMQGGVYRMTLTAATDPSVGTVKYVIGAMVNGEAGFSTRFSTAGTYDDPFEAMYLTLPAGDSEVLLYGIPASNTADLKIAAVTLTLVDAFATTDNIFYSIKPEMQAAASAIAKEQGITIAFSKGISFYYNTVLKKYYPTTFNTINGYSLDKPMDAIPAYLQGNCVIAQGTDTTGTGLLSTGINADSLSSYTNGIGGILLRKDAEVHFTVTADKAGVYTVYIPAAGSAKLTLENRTNGTKSNTQTITQITGESASCTGGDYVALQGLVLEAGENHISLTSTNNVGICQLAFVKNPDHHTVTFQNPDGSILSVQKIYEESDLKLPTKHLADGYRFDMTGYDGASDFTVTATAYTTNTVTFLDYDGTVLSVKDIVKGSAEGAPDMTGDAGFKGWAKDGHTTIVDVATLTADTTLRAQSNGNGTTGYRVSFYDMEGNLISRIYTAGGAVEAPAYTAFDFAGWSEGVSNITKDTDVYALSKLFYTVRYYAEDGTTLLSTERVRKYTDAVGPDVSNYADFKGWMTRPNGNASANLSSITANMNVYMKKKGELGTQASISAADAKTTEETFTPVSGSYSLGMAYYTVTPSDPITDIASLDFNAHIYYKKEGTSYTRVYAVDSGVTEYYTLTVTPITGTATTATVPAGSYTYSYTLASDSKIQTGDTELVYTPATEKNPVMLFLPATTEGGADAAKAYATVKVNAPQDGIYAVDMTYATSTTVKGYMHYFHIANVTEGLGSGLTSFRLNARTHTQKQATALKLNKADYMLNTSSHQALAYIFLKEGDNDVKLWATNSSSSETGLALQSVTFDILLPTTEESFIRATTATHTITSNTSTGIKRWQVSLGAKVPFAVTAANTEVLLSVGKYALYMYGSTTSVTDKLSYAFTKSDAPTASITSPEGHIALTNCSDVNDETYGAIRAGKLAEFEVTVAGTYTFTAQMETLNNAMNCAGFFIVPVIEDVPTHTVTFMDGDTLLSMQSVPTGFAAVNPDESIVWDTDFSNITADTVVYAKKDIKVIFRDWDGTPLTDWVTAPGGIAHYPGKEPTRDFYIFVGWNRDVNNIKEDCSIYAVYKEKETITVTYTADGAQYGDTLSIYTGDTVTLPTYEELSSTVTLGTRILAGWLVDGELYKAGSETEIWENTVITADLRETVYYAEGADLRAADASAVTEAVAGETLRTVYLTGNGSVSANYIEFTVYADMAGIYDLALLSKRNGGNIHHLYGMNMTLKDTVGDYRSNGRIDDNTTMAIPAQEELLVAEGAAYGADYSSNVGKPNVGGFFLQKGENVIRIWLPSNEKTKAIGIAGARLTLATQVYSAESEYSISSGSSIPVIYAQGPKKNMKNVVFYRNGEVSTSYGDLQNQGGGRDGTYTNGGIIIRDSQLVVEYQNYLIEKSGTYRITLLGAGNDTGTTFAITFVSTTDPTATYELRITTKKTKAGGSIFSTVGHTADNDVELPAGSYHIRITQETTMSCYEAIYLQCISEVADAIDNLSSYEGTLSGAEMGENGAVLTGGTASTLTYTVDSGRTAMFDMTVVGEATGGALYARVNGDIFTVEHLAVTDGVSTVARLLVPLYKGQNEIVFYAGDAPATVSSISLFPTNAELSTVGSGTAVATPIEKGELYLETKANGPAHHISKTEYTTDKAEASFSDMSSTFSSSNFHACGIVTYRFTIPTAGSYALTLDGQISRGGVFYYQIKDKDGNVIDPVLGGILDDNDEKVVYNSPGWSGTTETLYPTAENYFVFYAVNYDASHLVLDSIPFVDSGEYTVELRFYVSPKVDEESIPSTATAYLSSVSFVALGTELLTTVENKDALSDTVTVGNGESITLQNVRLDQNACYALHFAGLTESGVTLQVNFAGQGNLLAGDYYNRMSYKAVLDGTVNALNVTNYYIFNEQTALYERATVYTAEETYYAKSTVTNAGDSLVYSFTETVGTTQLLSLGNLNLLADTYTVTITVSGGTLRLRELSLSVTGDYIRLIELDSDTDRIIVASDNHYASGNKQGLTDANAQRLFALEMVNAKNEGGLAAAFFAGDYTTTRLNANNFVVNGQVYHYAMAYETYTLFAALRENNIPQFVTHAGHDHKSSEEWYDLFGYEKNYMVKIGDTLYICIDYQYAQSDYYAYETSDSRWDISDEFLAAVNKALARTDVKYGVIVSHSQWYSNHPNAHSLYSHEKVMASYAGHTHYNTNSGTVGNSNANTANGKPYIQTSHMAHVSGQSHEAHLGQTLTVYVPLSREGYYMTFKNVTADSFVTLKEALKAKYVAGGMTSEAAEAAVNALTEAQTAEFTNVNCGNNSSGLWYTVAYTADGQRIIAFLDEAVNFTPNAPENLYVMNEEGSVAAITDLGELDMESASKNTPKQADFRVSGNPWGFRIQERIQTGNGSYYIESYMRYIAHGYHKSSPVFVQTEYNLRPSEMHGFVDRTYVKILEIKVEASEIDISAN